jgi:hypothetical protein
MANSKNPVIILAVQVEDHKKHVSKLIEHSVM